MTEIEMLVCFGRSYKGVSVKTQTVSCCNFKLLKLREKPIILAPKYSTVFNI